MKTILLIGILVSLYQPAESAQRSDCVMQEALTNEYIEWKRNFHKFLLDYETLNSSERFTTSKDSLKNILQKMQVFSDRTLVPVPQATYSHARGLLTEVEEKRMARTTALPIMKSSLQKLETTMDDMLAKAQWKHPNCDLGERSASR